MTRLQKTLAHASGAVALAVVAWVLGGFMAWDWNPAHWSGFGRAMLVTAWLGATWAAGLVWLL